MGKVKNNKIKESFLNDVGKWIVYLMIAVIPHIYYYTGYRTKVSENKFFREEYYADIYMLAKSRIFLLLTIVLLAIFLYQLVRKKIMFMKDKVTLGAILFAIVVVLSSIISKYSDLVYTGAKDRHEGMWIWLSYISLFIIARHLFNGKQYDDCKQILKVLVFSSTLMSIFGIMQVVGYDVYIDGPLKWLCFPSEIASNIDQYLITSSTSSLAVGALYNSNYFGVYTAFSLAISIINTIKEDEKKQMWILFSVINYGALLASKSESALICLALGLFMIFIYYFEDVKSRPFYPMLMIVIFIGLSYGFSLYFGDAHSVGKQYIYLLIFFAMIIGMIGNYLIKTIKKEEKNVNFIIQYSGGMALSIVIVIIIIFNIAISILPSTTSEDSLEILEIEGNNLLLKIKNYDLINIKFQEDVFLIYDINGTLVSISSENDIYVVENTPYKIEIEQYAEGYKFRILKPIDVDFFYDNSNLHFIDVYSGISEIEYPERIDFYHDKGSVLSARGYIWGTYIPVALDNLIIGNGPDTFALIFPQRDIIGKSQYFKTFKSSLVIDKPHSQYLSLALSFGIVNLLLFLLLVVIVVKNIIISQFSNYRIDELIVVSIYLVGGIFNDSIIPLTIIGSILLALVIENQDSQNVESDKR